ncbi:MAG: L,D-transpeptidase [Phycisphaerales bacterium]|nr:L,D-transpeptidase [Phycisphaerales bacterium]
MLATLGTAILMAWTTSTVIGRSLAEPPTWPELQTVRAPRVVVVKSKRTLYLFDGDRLVRAYPVALGVQPVGQKTHAGDGHTPEGVFRVCTRTTESRYHRFLGISYPDKAAALRGLRDGLISFGEFHELIAADEKNQCPSWSTALGGGIGLHGHGSAGDWSAGCVALDDADIEELFDVLRVGDEVEILP